MIQRIRIRRAAVGLATRSGQPQSGRASVRCAHSCKNQQSEHTNTTDRRRKVVGDARRRLDARAHVVFGYTAEVDNAVMLAVSGLT